VLYKQMHCNDTVPSTPGAHIHTPLHTAPIHLLTYNQFVLGVQQKLEGLHSCQITYNLANFIFEQQCITTKVLCNTAVVSTVG